MIALKNRCFRQVIWSVSLFLGLTFSTFASTVEISAGTAIPILLSRSIDSRKAKNGDLVTAKTIQIVKLPSGGEIPKNSTVLGHIVAVKGNVPNEGPSQVSIRFESIVVNKETVPIRTSLRALASPNESYEALYPRGPVGSDYPQTTTLVGGAYTYLLDKHVYAPNGKIIGENRSNGVFARLQAAGCDDRNTNSCCRSTESLQSIGIFSPSACGLYGFGDTEMTATGDADRSGTFTLESSDSFVRIYGRSTALLQVLGTT